MTLADNSPWMPTFVVMTDTVRMTHEDFFNILRWPKKEFAMKVTEIKNELEKVSKVIPELRQKLDEVYSLDSGKKSRIKLLWKQYESKHREIKNSREFKNLDLH